MTAATRSFDAEPLTNLDRPVVHLPSAHPFEVRP